MPSRIKTFKPITRMIYAFTTPNDHTHDGWVKIGDTTQDVDKRINQIAHTIDAETEKQWAEEALYLDKTSAFRDYDFHKYLRSIGIERKEGTEFFKIKPQTAQNELANFKSHKLPSKYSEIIMEYRLRSEQEEAVNAAYDHFINNPNSQFLFNCKPRFGKSLATYELCRKLKAKKILIITNRPTIANSWLDDYKKFVGHKDGLSFVSHVDEIKNISGVLSYEFLKENTPNGEEMKFIYFVSLQDIKGSKYFGTGEHDKLKELIDEKWDILVIDEAHEAVDTDKTEIVLDSINRKWTLHLSGTPFKALAENKFKPDEIYHWTYADEQEAKRNWNEESEDENPYLSLPKINLYTYSMSEMIQEKIKTGININGEQESYTFDLNEFFKTKRVNDIPVFIHNSDVDKFLDALVYQEKYPFSTKELRDELKHTFWLLQYVDSAKALAKKLENHPVFENYKIICIAGDGKVEDEEKAEKEEKGALAQVKKAINENDKTITISAGRLTTGVTVPEWSAVLMLSNVKTPSLYIQTAFRSQNPHEYIKDGKMFRKENAYIFDFDPARTLDIFQQFACDLYPSTSGQNGSTKEKEAAVKRLLNFFPVIGEDNEGKMIELDAEKIFSIPHKIHAREVVNSGFTLNILFKNIGNIFKAPQKVRDIVKKMTSISESKKDFDVPDDMADKLHLGTNGQIVLADEDVKKLRDSIFTEEKIFGVQNDVEAAVELSVGASNKDKKDANKLVSEALMQISNECEKYNHDTKKQKKVVIINKAKDILNKAIEKNSANYNKEIAKIDEYTNSEKFKEAVIQMATEKNKPIEDIKKGAALKIEKLKEKAYQEKIIEPLQNTIPQVVSDTINALLVSSETDDIEVKKKDKEDDMRDHLRGFSKSVPSFLMAYGNRNTTLENFDTIVPEQVFLDITGITIEEFKELRDGIEIVNEDGEKEFFETHYFDEILFNGAIQEFFDKRDKLSNYFDETLTENIFDYIPNLKSNQIFTPKNVVIEMVDMLEENNHGCFDNPEFTFVDPYMKSGLFIAEIVKRLFKSDVLKAQYPNETDRLKHIFEKQVYGCAPTEIIYQIVLNFVLGFDKNKEIKHNLIQFDTLEDAKNGTLNEALKREFKL